MDLNINNIGIGTGAFGIGDQMNAGSQKVEGAKVESRDVKLSGPQPFDVLRGSEPVADVPAEALVRDDDLGRLVSAAFNLPPPPMPAFGA